MRRATPDAPPRAGDHRLTGYPLVGNLPRMLREPLKTLLDAQRDLGDVVRVDLAPQSFYLLSRPDHVRRVLQENPGNYTKGYARAATALLGNGLVLNEGEPWLRQRRMMQPAFHRRRLAGFAETMVEETQEMLERWDTVASEGRPFDVAREMKDLTRSIVVRTMFGTAVVGAQGAKIGQAFDDVLAGIEVRALLPALFARLPIPSNRRFERATRTLEKEVNRTIGERRRSGSEGDDLLGMLMSARDEETGEPMGDRQLRDEVLTIYLAGHETTANALSWVWYLLSKSPEAARNVREEVARVLGGRYPGLEDLPRLVRTRMVVDETLRLYPPAWFFMRTAVESDSFGEHRIPAGSLLMLSPYVTHRRSDLWENPEGFDPERFAPEREKGRPRYSYYPFGGGPRQCIGNNFALMEATLIVAAVAQDYRLDLVPGREVKARPTTTLGPRPGVWVTAQKHPHIEGLPRAGRREDDVPDGGA